MTRERDPLIAIVRADANERIGMGHVMRSLALAGALAKRGARVTFAMIDPSPKIRARVRVEGHALHVLRAKTAGNKRDRDALVALSEKSRALLLVLDSYAFDENFISSVRTETVRTCVIEDAPRPRLRCDAISNGNLYASARTYRGARPALFVGPDHALLRAEIADARPRTAPRAKRDVRKILLTMGGADPSRATERILRAMRLVSGSLEVRVVVGPTNPRLAEIRREAAATTSHRVQVLFDVRDMSREMLACDLAIAAAGSSCLELSCLGVPSIAIAVAENQRPVALALKKAGAMVILPERAIDREIARQISATLEDSSLRATMIRKQRALVDGCGADRVARGLVSLVNAGS